MVQIKLLSDLYLPQFLDTLAKSCKNYYIINVKHRVIDAVYMATLKISLEMR